MKVQSAIEFLTTYSWAFLTLGIFVVTVISVVFSPSRGAETFIPEACYISPSFPCYQAVMYTNSISTSFLVLFQNNLGVGLRFPSSNSLLLSPFYFKNTTYWGGCLPLNTLVGSTVMCNATFTGQGLTVGAQLEPRFTINYKICSPICTNQIYNTSGTAVTVVSPYKSVVYQVTLRTNPTDGGQISLGGVRYSNGANVIFISGINYPIFAIPPPGNAFSSWSNTLGAFNALSSQSTTANAAGPGTLTAVFVKSS